MKEEGNAGPMNTTSMDRSIADDEQGVTVEAVEGRTMNTLHAMQTLQSDIFKGEFKYFFQARDLSKI